MVFRWSSYKWIVQIYNWIAVSVAMDLDQRVVIDLLYAIQERPLTFRDLGTVRVYDGRRARELDVSLQAYVRQMEDDGLINSTSDGSARYHLLAPAAPYIGVDVKDLRCPSEVHISATIRKKARKRGQMLLGNSFRIG